MRAVVDRVGRCIVPGCRVRGAERLEAHHVVKRSRGGRERGNAAPLCRTHHRAADQGWLVLARDRHAFYGWRIVRRPDAPAWVIMAD